MVMRPMFSQLLGPIRYGLNPTSEIFNKIGIFLSRGVYIFYSKQNIDKQIKEYINFNCFKNKNIIGYSEMDTSRHYEICHPCEDIDWNMIGCMKYASVGNPYHGQYPPKFDKYFKHHAKYELKLNIEYPKIILWQKNIDTRFFDKENKLHIKLIDTYKYYGENSDTAICIITTNDKNVLNLPIKSQKFEIN